MLEVMIIMGLRQAAPLFEYRSEHVLPPEGEYVKRSIKCIER